MGFLLDLEIKNKCISRNSMFSGCAKISQCAKLADDTVRSNSLSMSIRLLGLRGDLRLYNN